MRNVILAALLAASFTSPALAGWQYTDWGMTAQQVVAASKGAATLAASPEHRPNGWDILVTTPYTVAGTTYDGHFNFIEGKLVDVQLRSREDGCGNVADKLSTVYGEPRDQDIMGITRKSWSDPQHNNAITFTRSTNLCVISYDPMQTGL